MSRDLYLENMVRNLSYIGPLLIGAVLPNSRKRSPLKARKRHIRPLSALKRVTFNRANTTLRRLIPYKPNIDAIRGTLCDFPLFDSFYTAKFASVRFQSGFRPLEAADGLRENKPQCFSIPAPPQRHNAIFLHAVS